MNHTTTHIQYKDMEADVDEKVAPLVLALWKRGIETLFSCQDYGESMDLPDKKGWGYIQFDPENLCKFLDLVQIPTKDLGLPEAPIHPWPFFMWHWEVYPVWDLELSKTKLMTMAVFPIQDAEIIIRATEIR